MAHGTARAFATACLGLIALQALSTRGGSGRVAELLTDANELLDRVLDPTVPAIKDRSSGSYNPDQLDVFQVNPDGTVGLGPAFGSPIVPTPVPPGGLPGLPSIPVPPVPS